LCLGRLQAQAQQHAAQDLLRVVLQRRLGQHGLDAVEDDRRFTAYMRQHGIDTMLVRPDFYLYGAVAEAGEVNRLVDDLARHGVRLAAAREREAVAG
jgi:hypothetical protein